MPAVCYETFRLTGDLQYSHLKYRPFSIKKFLLDGGKLILSLENAGGLERLT